MRSSRVCAPPSSPARRHVSTARCRGLVSTAAKLQAARLGRSDSARRRPSAASGTSLRPVWRPLALHSVSPWRTRTTRWAGACCVTPLPSSLPRLSGGGALLGSPAPPLERGGLSLLLRQVGLVPERVRH